MKIRYMTGKDKCEFLKGIRKRMAEVNGISYEPRECSNNGDCPGTCPFCEKEAEELLKELKKKEADGVEIKKDVFCIEAIKESLNDEDRRPLTGFNTLLANDAEKIKKERQKRDMLLLLEAEARDRESLMGCIATPYDEEIARNIESINKTSELLRQQLIKEEMTGEVERTPAPLRILDDEHYAEEAGASE